MPKVCVKSNAKLNKFVKEYGSDIFSTDGLLLFCKVCEKSINFEKKYFVSQHLNTSKHKSAATRMTEKQTCLISSYVAASSRKSQFSIDLCKAFVQAGIPLWKLENKSLRFFFEKYMNGIIPSESTIRKNYLETCYTEVLERIREECKDVKIWVSIDETTDVMGRYVANVIIGTMEIDQPSKVYLLTSEQLAKSNSTTVSQLFTNALNLLWPAGIKHDNVLLFLTDAAPYMKKAGRALKVLFPAMLHLTCLAHALHRVAEEIRGLFPDVDLLISNVKKIFLKAPSRIQVFREAAPELTLPPQPVLTRWGTWLSAALYYATNFNKIRDIVNQFSEGDASSIGIVKELLLKESLRQDLSFMASHFSILPNAITSLEKKNEPLVNSLKVVSDLMQSINSIPGAKARTVIEKCQRVLSANRDFEKIKYIGKVLGGESSGIIQMDPLTVARFKFAPITSVDVERSFSVLKYLLSDRRHSFCFENFKKHLVIMCNPKAI